MKRFFLWLCKPWVVSLIGFFILSFIIWFEAPLLSFNGKAPFEKASVRWFWIIFFFVIGCAYFIWKYVVAKLANLKLMQGVAGENQAEETTSPGIKESRAEVEALNKRMQDAMNILRKTKLGERKNNQYLYQLPWYMFVGAPGSGKTTALVQSGLKFPLAESIGKGAIGGVGGTRNCDWWFTDEAVLLDTAGRYTTQDSHSEVDKASWNGFLKMLKKHRPRRPINGIIVALSVADLLQESEVNRQQQALSIRERIKELHEQLGVRFPIYVMVTKCDLLAGFSDFFDKLSREERAQVWGVSFPSHDTNQVDTALASFPVEFKLLEKQLQSRLLSLMHQERDIQRRALIYSFPQQFAGIGDVLNKFLIDLFQSTRYEEQALLRGVYFCSGTQEGNPIDRVMNAMAAAFGLGRQVLPSNANSGRSYFITRLLKDVIFPEATLVGHNRQLERKLRWVQWGSIAAMGIVTIVLTAGLITSYIYNRNFVRDVNEKIVNVDRQAKSLNYDQTSPLQLLPLLNVIRDLPAGYAEKDDNAPFLMTLGLYQGDKLGAGAQTVYRKILRNTLLPLILNRMSEQLRRGSSNNPEYLYEVLRVYLMLNDPKNFDAESITAWVDYDLRRNLKGANEEQRQALSAHVFALLENFNLSESPPQLDTQLISDTRLALARMPVSERIYNQLKRELARSKLPEFSVAVAGGRDVPQVFVRRSNDPLTRGIPGIYTVAGYKKFQELSEKAILEIEKDSWVLAKQEAVSSPVGIEQAKLALQQLYFNDYIAIWDAYLLDVTIVPFGSLEQGARITNILSSADSPLRKFLIAASKETTLENSVKTPKYSVSETVKNKIDSYKNKLESAIGSSEDEVADATPKVINPVDAHFEALHRLVGVGGNEGSIPLDQTLAMLKDVAAYLDAAGAAKRSGTTPPASDALSRLKREGDVIPEPLGSVLKNIESAGGGLTLGSERERLNSLWASGPSQFCKQAIAGRYPIAHNSTQEITQDDFGKFFSPNGLMDDFIQRNLMPYIDMGGKQWRWRSSANNVSLGISQEVLNEFQKATQIRDTFFSGGKQVSMRFDIKPIIADPIFSKITLDIDGQQVVYASGQINRQNPIQLPSGKSGGDVRFEAVPAIRSDLRTDGAWSWFRMIDKGVLEPTIQAERFKLTFELDGRRVSYELTANSVINPFKRDILWQFRCVDRL